MKPEQALEILTNVTGTFKGSRQEHINIQAALNVVANLIEINNQKQAKKAAKKTATRS